MIATPVPVTLLPPQGSPRTPGVHVSGIIRGIAMEQGILKPEWVEEFSLVEVTDDGSWLQGLDTTSRLRVMIGLAWEHFYLQCLPTVSSHPYEMCVEGTYMTHDGESLDTIVTERDRNRMILALHEIKATYKSVNTVWNPEKHNYLDSQWMWNAQCKAYCKGLGTTRAYLHPLFLCGDYTWPQRPRLGPIEGQETCFRIDYTQEEIDDNWDLLQDYKHHRLQMEREGLV